MTASQLNGSKKVELNLTGPNFMFSGILESLWHEFSNISGHSETKRFNPAFTDCIVSALYGHRLEEDIRWNLVNALTGVAHSYGFGGVDCVPEINYASCGTSTALGFVQGRCDLTIFSVASKGSEVKREPAVVIELKVNSSLFIDKCAGLDYQIVSSLIGSHAPIALALTQKAFKVYWRTQQDGADRLYIYPEGQKLASLEDPEMRVILARIIYSSALIGSRQKESPFLASSATCVALSHIYRL